MEKAVVVFALAITVHTPTQTVVQHDPEIEQIVKDVSANPLCSYVNTGGLCRLPEYPQHAKDAMCSSVTKCTGDAPGANDDRSGTAAVMACAGVQSLAGQHGPELAGTQKREGERLQ